MLESFPIIFILIGMFKCSSLLCIVVRNHIKKIMHRGRKSILSRSSYFGFDQCWSDQHDHLIFTKEWHNNNDIVLQPMDSSFPLGEGDWTNVIIPGDMNNPGFTHMRSYLISGLLPESEYECLVQARNRFGWSDASRLFTFFTSTKGKLFIGNFKFRYVY